MCLTNQARTGKMAHFKNESHTIGHSELGIETDFRWTHDLHRLLDNNTGCPLETLEAEVSSNNGRCTF